MAKKEKPVVSVHFRFPESLHQQIKAAAQQNLRSINAELNKRLMDSFERSDEARAHRD